MCAGCSIFFSQRTYFTRKSKQVLTCSSKQRAGIFTLIHFVKVTRCSGSCGKLYMYWWCGRSSWVRYGIRGEIWTKSVPVRDEVTLSPNCVDFSCPAALHETFPLAYEITNKHFMRNFSPVFYMLKSEKVEPYITVATLPTQTPWPPLTPLTTHLWQHSYTYMDSTRASVHSLLLVSALSQTWWQDYLWHTRIGKIVWPTAPQTRVWLNTICAPTYGSPGNWYIRFEIFTDNNDLHVKGEPFPPHWCHVPRHFIIVSMYRRSALACLFNTGLHPSPTKIWNCTCSAPMQVTGTHARGAYTSNSSWLIPGNPHTNQERNWPSHAVY